MGNINYIQMYYIRHVVMWPTNLLTAIYKSPPVASWDNKASIEYTLQNPKGSVKTYRLQFSNTMNSDVYYSIAVLYFVYYIL